MQHHDLSEDLHWPGRANCIEGIEEHLNVAAGLARALWTAIDGIGSDIDPRDKVALYELSGCVSDHASAARYAYYISHESDAAAAPADDPIFAAIKAHQAAWATLSNAGDRTDTVLVAQLGGKVTEKDRAAFEAARGEEAAVRETLVATSPTTKAGARAALEWLFKYDDGCEPSATYRFIETLLASPVLASEARA